MDHNRRHYEGKLVGARYATRSGIHEDEAAILHRYRRHISGKRILDLGVGGGRTTPFLLELGPDYVGVDYSPQMIQSCRRRIPGVTFEVADARDLSRFPAASFDFVLFSFNGIDATDPAGRLAVLREVHRTLTDGGLFVFSSHNRNYRIPKPWDVRHFAVNPLRDPIRFGKRTLSYPVGIINYLRRAHRKATREEYCISIDSAHLYSLIHYRITADAQEKQLERLGFSVIEAVGIDGRRLTRRESQIAQDPWIQYVCRRRKA
jgi:SAM-dependent methyltransferase